MQQALLYGTATYHWAYQLQCDGRRESLI